MEHMLKYLPKAIQIYIPMNYIQSGDNYESVVKKDVIILKNERHHQQVWVDINQIV